MKRSLFVAAILCLFLSSANAGVVVNSNFTLSPFGANYNFTAFQNEAGTDPTSLIVALSGQTLVPQMWNVDESADYYLVPNLAVFSASTISLGTFPPLLVVGQPSSLNVGFGDFYLGINTGQGFVSAGHPNRDVFGWVHLNNQPGIGLTMIGNAMSYGGQGIVVGTTTVVPEPSSGILVVLGIGIALLASRGKLSRARALSCSAKDQGSEPRRHSERSREIPWRT